MDYDVIQKTIDGHSRTVVCYEGSEYVVSDICKKKKMNPGTVSHRIRKGVPFAELFLLPGDPMMRTRAMLPWMEKVREAYGPNGAYKNGWFTRMDLHALKSVGCFNGAWIERFDDFWVSAEVNNVLIVKRVPLKRVYYAFADNGVVPAEVVDEIDMHAEQQAYEHTMRLTNGRAEKIAAVQTSLTNKKGARLGTKNHNDALPPGGGIRYLKAEEALPKKRKKQKKQSLEKYLKRASKESRLVAGAAIFSGNGQAGYSSDHLYQEAA